MSSGINGETKLNIETEESSSKSKRGIESIEFRFAKPVKAPKDHREKVIAFFAKAWAKQCLGIENEK